MQIATIWTLTTDTDNGMMTSVHTSEFSAWLALIAGWIGNIDDSNLRPEQMAERDQVLGILLACESDGNYSRVSDWFEALMDGRRSGSCDSYSIDSHDIASAYERDRRNARELKEGLKRLTLEAMHELAPTGGTIAGVDHV